MKSINGKTALVWKVDGIYKEEEWGLYKEDGQPKHEWEEEEELIIRELGKRVRGAGVG
jgi:hypothetical protein